MKMRSIHELLSVGIQDTKLYFCYKVVLHATLSGMKEKPDVLSLSKMPPPSVLTSAKTMLVLPSKFSQVISLQKMTTKHQLTSTYEKQVHNWLEFRGEFQIMWFTVLCSSQGLREPEYVVAI